MLSQEEIDALLAQATAPAPADGGGGGGGGFFGGELLGAEHEVKLYDFKRPEKFSREQLRNLERLHERFARLLSTTLSAYVRTNIIVKIESVTPLSYHEFVYSLPQPTLIHVIELDPLPGQAALEMTPTVVFPMYEHMMGGRRHKRGMRLRQLTDVELVLFQRPLERMMQCLAETWHDFVKIRPRLIRVEQDPQFAQVAATNTPVVVVSLEVTLGDDFGMMSLCMPDILVDALLHYLGQDRIVADRNTPDRDLKPVRNVITDITLPITGELGRSQLTVDQIRDLRIGDIVRLQSEAGEDVDVYIGDQLLFRGRVGQRRRKVALQLTDKLPVPLPLDEIVRETAAEQVEAEPVADEPAEGEGDEG